MYAFSQAVAPALRSHLDAQVSFLNDISKSLSRTFQNVCDLNIELSKTMLEEGNLAGQQLLTTNNASDALTVASSRAQPAADWLRAYQQHVTRIVADAQIDLARVTQQHSPLTSRTRQQESAAASIEASADAKLS